MTGTKTSETERSLDEMVWYVACMVCEREMGTWRAGVRRATA